MIKGGSVFCSDMSKYPEETMKAINEMGIRGVISTPERDNEKGELEEKNDEENKKLLEEKKQKIIEFINMKNINEERIMKCISIPSIFTVSEEFLKFYSEVAKKNNMYIHIMVSETKEEVDDLIQLNDVLPETQSPKTNKVIEELKDNQLYRSNSWDFNDDFDLPDIPLPYTATTTTANVTEIDTTPNNKIIENVKIENSMLSSNSWDFSDDLEIPDFGDENQ